MRLIIPLVLAVSLAACGGTDTVSPPEGPLKLSIIAGQNQIANAGSKQLTDPVVGQLVRQPVASGGSRFVFVRTAHAQTVVNGSPVVGAVVCSETVSGELKSFVPCTNTNALGKATFFYEPGTKSGEAKAEIRGLSALGQPVVFDTVKATVNVGALDRTFRLDSGNRPKPAVVNADAVRDIYANPYPYRIVSDSLLTVSGDIVGTVEARTITWATPTAPKYNRKARVLGTNGLEVARLDYLLYTDGTIEWHMLGLDR